MFLTRRLAIVVALGAIVAPAIPLRPPFGVMVVTSVVALLALLDVRWATKPTQLLASRELPGSAEVGRPGIVTIRVTNPTSRAIEVNLHDATPPSLQRSPVRHRIVVDGAADAEALATFEPTRRGAMHIGPLSVRVTGPLGLAGRQQVLPMRETLKVFPPLPGRLEVQKRLEQARALQSGEHSTTFRGGGTEFEALREYHPDDEYRRINWIATARAGKPITNVYREQKDQQVLILVDASRMMAGTVQGRSRFEYAIDTAHSLTELATRVGDRVGMAAFDVDVRAMAAPRSSHGQSAVVLDLLYLLEPTLHAPNYRGAFAAVLRRYPRRALLVLLTELTEPGAMDPLFEAIPVLRARHLVVVGSIRDPELREMETLVPRSPEDAYLKAAASTTVLARDRAAARLRAMGCGVIDTVPSQLTGIMADRYLDIKARGRL